MNNICIFCNSEAETYEHLIPRYSCKSCSDMLNLTVWWRSNQYISFYSYSNFIAGYHTQIQRLALNDGTVLTIPPDKVITKLQTILLLS